MNTDTIMRCKLRLQKIRDVIKRLQSPGSLSRGFALSIKRSIHLRIKKKKNVKYSISKSFLAGITKQPVEYYVSSIIILHLNVNYVLLIQEVKSLVSIID